MPSSFVPSTGIRRGSIAPVFYLRLQGYYYSSGYWAQLDEEDAPVFCAAATAADLAALEAPEGSLCTLLAPADADHCLAVMAGGVWTFMHS